MSRLFGDLIVTGITIAVVLAVVFGLAIPGAPWTKELQAAADSWSEKQKLEQLRKAAELGVYDTIDREDLTEEMQEIMEERDKELALKEKDEKKKESAERKKEKDAVKKENEEELVGTAEKSETSEDADASEVKAAAEDEENAKDKKDDNQEEVAKNTPSKYILVGDSRFVGMQLQNNNEEDFYIDKGATGIVWLKQSENEIKRAETDDSVIVIGLGVNDLWDINRYIEYVNNAGYRSKTYFLTVGPVDHAKFSKFDNSSIEDFNNKLIEGAENYEVIDLYQFLNNKDLGTTDGLHYTFDTYKRMYQFIKESVNEENVV